MEDFTIEEIEEILEKTQIDWVKYYKERSNDISQNQKVSS